MFYSRGKILQKPFSMEIYEFLNPFNFQTI